MDNRTAKHIIFTGRVQGVGFRFTAYNLANRHSLTGIVRNLPNGTVEMLIQGNPNDIDHCIRDIQDSFAGFITEAIIKEVPYDPQLEEFKITF